MNPQQSQDSCLWHPSIWSRCQSPSIITAQSARTSLSPSQISSQQCSTRRSSSTGKVMEEMGFTKAEINMCGLVWGIAASECFGKSMHLWGGWRSGPRWSPSSPQACQVPCFLQTTSFCYFCPVFCLFICLFVGMDSAWHVEVLNICGLYFLFLFLKI